MTPSEKLLALLHHEIPLSRAVGMHDLRAEQNRLSLSAPLAPNINHKDTAFGGSLYTLAVAAGWAMVQHRLLGQALSGQVVIFKSEMEYLKPVQHDFTMCARLEEKDWQRAVKMLQRRGQARVPITVTASEPADAIVFHGQYVILAVAQGENPHD